MDPRLEPGNLMRFESPIPFTLIPGCGES